MNGSSNSGSRHINQLWYVNRQNFEKGDAGSSDKQASTVGVDEVIVKRVP